MEVTWLTGLALAVLALGSASVQGLTGMGFALVGMSFCSMLLGPRDANVLWTLAAATMLAYMTWQLWEYARWRLAGWMVAGSVLGLPAGVFLLATAPPPILKRIIGGTIMVFAVYYLVNPSVHSRDLSEWWGIPAGLVSGFLGGLTNMSGPPVGLFGIAAGLEKKEFKGTLTVYFAWTVIYKVFVLSFYKGLMRPEHGVVALLLVVPILAGVQLGLYLASYFSTQALRRTICVLILIPAVTLLLT